jgi:hypothetical protein
MREARRRLAAEIVRLRFLTAPPSPPTVLGFDPARADGITVVRSEHVPQGTAYLTTAFGARVVIEGVRDRTLLEDVRHEARSIVREGLADVLEWLAAAGRPVYPQPRMRTQSFHGTGLAFDFNVDRLSDEYRLRLEERIALEVRRPTLVSDMKITGL